REHMYPDFDEISAADGTWHERTEIGLLHKLYDKSLGEAERRARENSCDKHGPFFESEQRLMDYIKWDQAEKAFLSQLKSGSAFDKKFGSTIKDGVIRLENPRSAYRESDFDQY